MNPSPISIGPLSYAALIGLWFILVCSLLILFSSCNYLPASRALLEEKVSREALERTESDLRLAQFDELQISASQELISHEAKKNKSHFQELLDEKRDSYERSVNRDMNLSSITGLFPTILRALSGDPTALISGFMGLTGLAGGGLWMRERQQRKRDAIHFARSAPEEAENELKQRGWS